MSAGWLVTLVTWSGESRKLLSLYLLSLYLLSLYDTVILYRYSVYYCLHSPSYCFWCFSSRFLYSRPQMPTPNPIPSPLSGPEDQESPLAPQGLPSPADWSSFLHASLSGEGPDTNPAHLTLTEAEQRELYEAARHAHHTLRKYKVLIITLKNHSKHYKIQQKGQVEEDFIWG